MENIILGFLTGGSLILALGPQNIFVIEQGLKRNFVFTITTICAFSDVLLIFFGIFIYHVFNFIPLKVEIFLNIVLVLFLLRFIQVKFKELKKRYKIKNIKRSQNIKNIILKTLGFTYLNPHVYSDTVFILGNLSKNFLLLDKLYFAFGASISSIILIVLAMSPVIPDSRVEMVTALLSTYIVANLGIVSVFMGTTAFTRSRENGK